MIPRKYSRIDIPNISSQEMPGHGPAFLCAEKTVIPGIFLFTDFGVQGPYLGLMEAAITKGCPDVRVINLMCDAPRHASRPSAYLLDAMVDWIPPRGVVVAVVDPGVGSERKNLALRSHNRWFLGPDNGLLARIGRRDEQSQLWELHPEAHWPVSASFHGRDVFAPAAAMLACGGSPTLTSLPREEMVGFDWPSILAEVIYIDAFGNAMTGVPAQSVASSRGLQVRGQALPRVRTFSEVPEGALLCYENSLGLLEIAMNCGSAAEALGLVIGCPVDLDEEVG
jgi:S-adenosylmethionine hydrolase